MASPDNQRRLKDANLIVTGTLPNAANTTVATPYATTEKFHVRIEVGTATGANNKNVNIRLQDSADNSSFANVALVANPVLRSVDANNAGHSASNSIIQLPPNMRRYIRLAALGEANGGDSSDGTMTMSLMF